MPSPIDLLVRWSRSFRAAFRPCPSSPPFAAIPRPSAPSTSTTTSTTTTAAATAAAVAAVSLCARKHVSVAARWSQRGQPTRSRRLRARGSREPLLLPPSYPPSPYRVGPLAEELYAARLPRKSTAGGRSRTVAPEPQQPATHDPTDPLRHPPALSPLARVPPLLFPLLSSTLRAPRPSLSPSAPSRDPRLHSSFSHPPHPPPQPLQLGSFYHERTVFRRKSFSSTPSCLSSHSRSRSSVFRLHRLHFVFDLRLSTLILSILSDRQILPTSRYSHSTLRISVC